MLRFEEVVLRERPTLVIVYGDVNSTLACTLVCAKLGVPEVEGDPTPQAPVLLPVGHRPAGGPTDQGGQHPGRDPEAGGQLADVVEEGAGRPPGVSGVGPAGQGGLHLAGDAGRVALVVTGLAGP